MSKQKVLIFAGGLHIGGAERVAANISKYAPPGEFEFHYLVFDCNENVYGSEIEANGGKVFSVPLPRKGYWKYIRTIRSLMKEHQYVAVHSHTMFNSAINLLIAKLQGVPVRIAHSHTTRPEARRSFARAVYETVMRKVIVWTGTHFFACGVEAGKWLFGESVFERKGIVIRNGIETEAYRWDSSKRAEIRSQYGLEDAFVIGHTGTLNLVKNQGFLIRMLPDLLKIRPNTVLMLVGGNEGNGLARLQTIANELHVERHVIFTGAVLNVRDYLNAFDVFAFPSLREGTPLSLLEAQANGLPCIISDSIPDDVLLTDLITSLPLSDSGAWIDALVNSGRNASESYAEQLLGCGYDAKGAYAQIYDVYQGHPVRQKAMVSLSFDDARGDNLKAFEEILFPRNIPVTLNVTTGYVDGSCHADSIPCSKPPMGREDILYLAENPLVEIALHGDKHLNTPEDILLGKAKTIDWLGLTGHPLLGFASPKSKLTPRTWEGSEYGAVRSEVLYLRTTYRITNFKAVRTLSRKIGRIFHIPALFVIAYRNTEMAFRDKKIIYSVSVLKDTTVEQVCALVNDCIRRSNAVTLNFHSIIDNCTEEDAWSWETQKLERLCSFLQEKQNQGSLHLCTTKELLKKLQ